MSYQLLIDMAADIARLKSDMDQAKRVVSTSSQDISNTLSTIKKAFGALTAGLSVAGVTAYFKSMVVGAADAADKMLDLQQMTGVSARTLEGWSLSMSVAGIDADRVAKSIAVMNRNLNNATEETKGAASALAAFGINAKEFMRLSPEEQMLVLADAFEKTQDSGKKAAAAMLIFGREGQQMIPWLNQGRAGIEEYTRVAQDLGLVLDNDAREGLARLSDAIVVAQKSSSGFGKMLAAEFAPTIEGLVKWFIEARRQGGALADVLPILHNAFKGLLIGVVAVYGSLESFVKLVQAVIGAIKAAQDAGGLITQSGRSAAMAAWAKGWDDVKNSASGTLDRIRQIAMGEMPKLDSATRNATRTLGEFGNATEAARKTAEKLAQQFDDVVAKFRQMTTESRAQVIAGRELTAAEREYLRVLDDVTSGRKRYTAEQMKVIALAADEAMRAQQKLAIDRELIKISQEAERTRLKSIEDTRQHIAALDDEIAREQLSLRAMRGSEDAARQLANAKINETISSAERQRSLLLESGLDEDLVRLYDQQIDRLNKLRDLKQEQAATEASMKAAKAAREEWGKFFDDIERALTDALVRGFEGGKSVLRSIGDWIVNYFKTSVARGIAQAITGALGAALSGVASAATGGAAVSGVAGGASGLSGIISAISSAGPFASGVMATLFGGSGIGGSLTAAGSLLTSGSLAGTAAGLGMLAPYAAAAGGIYALITGIGTGRQRAPAYQQFGTYGGADFGYFAGSPNLALGGAGYFDQFVRGVADAVGAAVKSLGGTAGATSYGLYASVGSEGSGAYMRADVLGAAGNRLLYIDSNASNESLQQRLQDAIPRMILAGLQDSKLPEQIAAYLRQIDPAAASKEQIDAVIAAASRAHEMAEAFKDVGGVFASLSSISVEARENILGLVGGLDAFVRKTGAYISEYYSQEEQMAVTARAVYRSLQQAGIDTAGLTTKDQYRALVDALDLSTEIGQRQLAALINNADAFASLAKYLEKTSVEVEQLAQKAEANKMLSVVSDSMIIEKQEQMASATQQTAAHIAESNNVLSKISTSVAAIEEAVSTLLSQVASNTAQTAGAVTALGDRPVQVSVTVLSPEVNGGAV